MSDNELVERKVSHEIADTIAVGEGGITFRNAGEIMEYAKMMAASNKAVPPHLRGQPGSCLGIIDDAIRLDMNPYALAKGSYVVNDQLAYMGQVFAAIVNRRAPLKTRPDIRFEGEGVEMRAIVTGHFRDGAVREYKSPRIADISPKNSPLWKTDPAQQLSYYSLRAWARRWCPEVILGMYDVEELREAAMQDVTPLPPLPTSLDQFAAKPALHQQPSPSEIAGPPNGVGLGEPQEEKTPEPPQDTAPPAPVPPQRPEPARAATDWYVEGARAFAAGAPRRAPNEIRGTEAGLTWMDGYDSAKGE